MNEYFVDLHVHIGRSSNGNIIKWGTSHDLTFGNIAYEARHRKGINVIGVVDCISPWVIEDIDNMLDHGELRELPDGGMIYRDDLMLILGAEIETREYSKCSAHSLMFFPYLSTIKEFSNIMKNHMANILGNPTVARLSGQELFDIADGLGGIYIPAHLFTPYKGFYGACTDKLHKIFNDRAMDKIHAVEFGLSADTQMAQHVSELDGISFTSNSDAHSLPKMGREYNVMEMEGLEYGEVVKALMGQDGRHIVANYGLNPTLGKYHRTFCLQCEQVFRGKPPITACPNNPKHKIVMGVKDRLEIIKDRDNIPVGSRPPYYYQIPLEFLPGVGPKTIEKLIDKFETEMYILHNTSYDEIASVAGPKIADMIIKGREGRLNIEQGGGGIYGKISD